MSPKNIFKIRNNVTGLYSGGGYSPKWSKHGKIYKSQGVADNSLAKFLSSHNWRVRTQILEKDLEIVKFELVEVSVRSAVDVVIDMANKLSSKKVEREAKLKEAQRKADESEFNRLKKKLGI